jgi:O-antigen/teichoic acid export membrane protein
MIIATIARRGRQILATDFLRGVGLIAGGAVIAQVLPVLLTPLLTRLYAPEDMAHLGLYTSYLSFCANASTLGFSLAIVSGRSERESGMLTAAALLAVVPTSVLFSAGLSSLIYFDVVGFGALPQWVAIPMWLSLTLTGVFFSLRYWLIRAGSYARISQATVTQSVGRMLTQVLLGVIGRGWTGLVAGEVVGRASGLIRMWKSAEPSLSKAWHGVSRAELWQTATIFKKFPLLTAPSAMLNSLSLVLPVPLFAAYFGLFEAGQFAVAHRVLALPLSLIGASVADVFHGRLSIVSREAPERAFRLFRLVAIGLLLVGILPLLIVGIAGERIFPWLLGDQWMLAGLIASAIVPWTLMEFVVGPLSRVVLVYRGQEFKLIYDILAIISVVGCIIYGATNDLSMIETSRLLAWSQTAVFGVYFLLLVVILRKYRFINAISGDRDE